MFTRQKKAVKNVSAVLTVKPVAQNPAIVGNNSKAVLLRTAFLFDTNAKMC